MPDSPSNTDLPRKLFWLAYDGAAYGGWQVQRHEDDSRPVDLDAVRKARWEGNRPLPHDGASIQVIFDAALTQISGPSVNGYSGSRTDKGVHALVLPVHADLPAAWDNGKLCHALNGVLPPDIRVMRAIDAPMPGFHCRRDVLAKQYLYRIRQGRGASPMHAGRVWQIWRPLDIGRMRAAAQRIAGEHDFAAFHSRAAHNARTVIAIDDLLVQRIDAEIRILVRAPRFLRHMVRTIVAALVGAADGSLGLDTIDAALATGNRRLLPETAPPNGLYLAAAWVRGVGWWNGVDLL